VNHFVFYSYSNLATFKHFILQPDLVEHPKASLIVVLFPPLIISLTGIDRRGWILSCGAVEVHERLALVGD